VDKRRILVIDDEVGVARLLKLALEQEGNYEVRVENSGRAGLAAVQEFDPDVILLDMIMPDMTGQEVVAEMQSDPHHSKTPVVFLTAVPLREPKEILPAPVEGRSWISKPARVADVIAHIERALA
jgi:two-component system OmpR family response regulator